VTGVECVLPPSPQKSMNLVTLVCCLSFLALLMSSTPADATAVPTPSMLSFGHLETLAKAHLTNTNNDVSVNSTRHFVLEVTCLVGQLASSFLKNAPLDRSPDEDEQTNSWIPPDETRMLMGQVFFMLAVTAASCQLELQQCILCKLVLNEKKYPVDLCKGKSGKYTAYSAQTGITKTNGQNTDIYQTIVDENELVESLKSKITSFANDRAWNRFHTPRNLLLALIGELGELAELYQWKSDEKPSPEDDLQKVGQEIADVAIYLLRLAAVCQVDIGEYTVRQEEAAKDGTNQQK
jgi:dCTP diphosphatase